MDQSVVVVSIVSRLHKNMRAQYGQYNFLMMLKTDRVVDERHDAQPSQPLMKPESSRFLGSPT